MDPTHARTNRVTLDPAFREAESEPQHYIVIEEYFLVCRKRRRELVSGKPPAGIAGDRPIQARSWNRYQRLMSRPTPWERAEQIRAAMEGGVTSILMFARVTGQDFSKVARALKMLDLPEAVLERLRASAGNPEVRRCFTEKRLCRYLRDGVGTVQVLGKIDRMVGDSMAVLQIG